MARVISCGRTHQSPAPQVTHSWRCQPPLPPIDIYPLRQPLPLTLPLRVALTGKTVSPGIFEVLLYLGRAHSLARVAAAVAFLKQDA